MTGRRCPFIAAAVLAVSVPTAGCALRLSDPIYAFKDIHAEEPTHEGMSLLFGTIVVDQVGAGDLNSVTLAKLGPAQARSWRGANRVNLFRVFFRRTMKDGNFIIELEPGLYELDGFTTSGWGQPRTWNAKDEARKGMRVLVTRPGIYDIGTIRVGNPEVTGINERTYAMERTTENTPERRAVFERAIAGTRWEKLSASAVAAR